MARPALTRTDAPFVHSAVARFEKRLTLYATHLLGDVERARDVVQDTFLKLCAQDPVAVEPRLAEWLFTVCRNACMDVRRRERQLSFLSDSKFDVNPSPGLDPADAVARKDAARLIADALQHLTENQQEVIRLKFQHNLSYQEISNVTTLSVTNVGYLIHTGLKIVRQRLGARVE
ncbi:MAG: RNA polymerase sigma factor [Tepidisphaeraceae bacterium]